MARLKCIAASALLALALEGPAWAAHPLQTEDAGTQGAGNVEFENGLSWLRAGGARTFTYQPQLSYGLSAVLDMILQPSWISLRDGGRVRGSGDTNLDLKWRFVEAAPVSLAVRAGVTLPTSRRGLGLPHGKVSPHAVLVATFDAAPFTIHGNVGLARNPGGSGARKHVANVSSALMWAASDRLTLSLDAGAQSNPDASRSAWPGGVLAGAIYTVRPGLDIDFGYQRSVRAAVATHEWLFGFTWRFAP